MPTPRSRDDFPAMLNGLGLVGVAVEIGVDQGHYSEHFLEQWAGELLISVDTWGPYVGASPTQREADYAATKARLERFGNRSAVWRSTSVNAAKNFMLDPARPGGFDFVYIDGDHSYEGVMTDLKAWWPLVKPGGVIAGHDWVEDGWRHYGDGPLTSMIVKSDRPCWPCFVKAAVYDFFGDTRRLPPGRFKGLNYTDLGTDGGWRSWWVHK